MVLGQQQARAARTLPQPRRGPCVGRQRGDRRDPAARLQPSGEPEGTPLSKRALDPRLAAHQPRQAPGQREAKTAAAIPTRGRGIRLFKGLEQPRAGLGGDADAGVLDLEADVQRLAPILQQARANANAAGLGELDSIARIIEQGLAQPGRITAERARHLPQIDVDGKPLGLG